MVITVELDYGKYLDQRVLAKISGLDLRARMIVEGYFTGTHRSPYRGLSVEFADHRAYSQGDDLKHIDWKVYGRTNKYYIKEYEQETNLNLLLVVDCSESMAYASDGAALSKHDYATALGASLAYLALQQRDSVGLALFDEELTRLVRSSNNPAHWRTLVHELAGQTGPAKTSIRSVLDDLAERASRRALIVVLSDLFDDPDEILKGLLHLKFRRHDVVVFQVMDHAEIGFPFRGPTLFEGLEEAGRLFTEPRSLRDRYLEEVADFTAQMRVACRKMNIDFVCFDTSERLDAAIGAYLATRSASIRRRSSRVLGGN